MNSKQIDAALATLLAANGAATLAPGKRYEGNVGPLFVQAYGDSPVAAPYVRVVDEAAGAVYQAQISRKTGKAGKVGSNRL